MSPRFILMETTGLDMLEPREPHERDGAREQGESSPLPGTRARGEK